MNKKMLMMILLANGALLLAMEESLDEQLLKAVGQGRVGRVEWLLKRGANANAKKSYGATALMLSFNNEQLSRLLIAAGADVNATACGDQTPLMWAADKGNIGVCKLLIESGANVNARPNDFSCYQTPLIFAARNGHAQVCKLLIDNGADLTLTSMHKQSALHAAARDGHANTVMVLITAIPREGQQKIRQKITGLTAMKHAQPPLVRDVRRLITQEVINGLVNDQLTRIKQLILLPNKRGETARDVALVKHHPAIAEQLNLNNPESRERIRRQVEHNVRRVLFGEPVSREQLIKQQKKQTHYTILGVARNASQKQIKIAFNKLAMQYHPDKAQEHGYSLEEAQQLFIEVRQAYDVLSDPAKRAKYDATLK